MDRLDRFEMFCLFMFLLIAVSLLLKSSIARGHFYLLCEHERRISELEEMGAASPLDSEGASDE